MKTPIIDSLNNYISLNKQPWHMPGHKRKHKSITSESVSDVKRFSVQEVLNQIRLMDMTEVPGVDDLHNPTEMIRESMDELKAVYNSAASFYLVNGSTSGIHAAIAAYGNCGIIAADNCHKSVANITNLLNIKVSYLETRQNLKYPSIRGCVKKETLEKACIDNPEAGAVIITSPTYEGLVSNIKEIAEVTHRYGKVLIVDEAHGAHLPFMKRELSGIYSGADIVVQSLHKTLEAFTQTAIIHVMKEELVEKVRKNLSVFMSSSPSYILLASMEQAIANADGYDFINYKKDLLKFREKCSNLDNLNLLSEEDAVDMGALTSDVTRIIILTHKVSGSVLEKLLDREGNIVCEMSGLDYVCLISTYMDQKKDFDHLYETLKKVDELLDEYPCYEDNDKKHLSGEDKDYQNQVIPEIGRIVSEDIYVYPPGIPIVKKGEAITKELYSEMSELVRSGKKLRGI